MPTTITPLIADSKVVQVSLNFDEAITLDGFRRILEAINSVLNENNSPDRLQRGLVHRHRHSFTSYPVFYDGEMIAVVQKCSCGKTERISA